MALGKDKIRLIVLAAIAVSIVGGNYIYEEIKLAKLRANNKTIIDSQNLDPQQDSPQEEELIKAFRDAQEEGADATGQVYASLISEKWPSDNSLHDGQIEDKSAENPRNLLVKTLQEVTLSAQIAEQKAKAARLNLEISQIDEKVSNDKTGSVSDAEEVGDLNTRTENFGLSNERTMKRSLPSPKVQVKTDFDIAGLLGISGGDSAYLNVGDMEIILKAGDSYSNFKIDSVSTETVIISKLSNGSKRTLSLLSHPSVFRHPAIEALAENDTLNN